MSTSAEWRDATAPEEEVRDYPRMAYRRNDEPIPSLIRRLADEVTTLFAKELALLKSETTASVREAGSGVASMATGGAVTFAGILFLLVAAMLGLAQVMDMWLAALIVGGVVTLIGLIMLMSGRKKLEPEAFKPRHTASAMRKDRNMIKGATAHEQH